MTTAGTERATGASTHFLTCIAGPDAGKRIALIAGELIVGKSSRCNVLSDDPEIGDEYATLAFTDGRLHIRANAMPLPFVDGHSVTEASLSPGQQVRLGRSTWQVSGPTMHRGVYEFVNRLGDQISEVAGVEKPREWNPREMFSDVTKRRRDDEIEEYFTVGTSRTTAPLSAVDAHWPKPWVFVRVFVASLVLYLGFVWAWQEFNNVYLLPAIIMIGSVAMPFSLLIFFFEMNAPRNVSLYQVIRLLFLGGMLSIIVSLFGFKITDLDSWLGAASAGIIEETGKALALLIVVNHPKFRWTLNGLLLGATVGTGFAVFESAGYALSELLSSQSAFAMREVIIDRGFLTVFGGHVLWTGLVGAALWRVRGDRPFSREMLFDPKFVRVFLICVAMHMLWNMSIQLPLDGKYIVLGAVAWLLVLGFIQDGLKQIRDAQGAERANAITHPITV
ncbi:MAG TPA: PrsW family glutamic-type intramembrane protease [Gemmatimonadaceae bacterium]